MNGTTCQFCTKSRPVAWVTRRGLSICDPCKRDIARDTLSAPADFRPVREGR